MLVPEEKQRFERLLSVEAYNAAWRYASWLSANREDAEDLLQDSLISAVKNIHALRDEGRFRSWLLSIIRRRFIDRRRRNAVRLQPITELPELASPEPSIELNGPIAECLTQLPHAQQEILNLFYVDGLDLKDTGAVIGIPAKAVRQRLFRARIALRKKLAGISTIASQRLAVNGKIAGGGDCNGS